MLNTAPTEIWAAAPCTQYFPSSFVFKNRRSQASARTPGKVELVKRRTVLGLGVPGGASIATRVVGGAGESTPPFAVPRFEMPLKIPPVLEPTTRTETQDEYDIIQRESYRKLVESLGQCVSRKRQISLGPASSLVHSSSVRSRFPPHFARLDASHHIVLRQEMIRRLQLLLPP